jgi:hypothetical protein
MTEMLESIKTDLLSRRMLPLLVGVAVALVGAAGYALSAGGSSGGANPAPAPSPSLPSVASTMHVAVASVNPHAALAETPGGKRYQSQGSTRNPFAPLTPPPSPSGATTGPSGSSSGSGSTGSPTSASSTSGSAGTGSSSTGPSPGAGAPQTPILPKPKPIHVGLTSTQSYAVSLSLTTTGGGLDTIDSLERLSVLPSEQQPLLVYLGVLKGGRDALFVVQPGTVVSGPGVCLPGPTDCEILSLAQEQIESLAVSTGSGVSNVALFAVNAIAVEGHRSVASANRARREASAAGRSLLAASTLSALPLFEYQAHVGAVVDLRNLAVGGK